jgi:tetratricopeptide (TPR) repeat protein
MDLREHRTSEEVNSGAPLLGAPGDLRRGLSVSFISSQLLSCLDVKQGENVYDVEPRIRAAGAHALCPRDGAIGAAYVDVAKDVHADVAEIMLSYTWGYMVHDIVSCLEHHCTNKKLDTDTTRVWICCFCVNQFRVKEAQRRGESVSFEEFSGLFRDRVRVIGCVLAMVTPWRSPVYLTRVWCLYEAWTAITEDIELEFVFPEAEAESYQSELDNAGLQNVWKALGAVRVQDGQAYLEADRERILNLIQEAPGGFAAMNAEVVARLQAWFVSAASAQLERQFASSELTPDARPHECYAHRVKLCCKAADLLVGLGSIAAGEALAMSCLELCERNGISASLEAASLHAILAKCNKEQGDLATALKKYEEAKSMCSSVGMAQSKTAASIIRHIGSIHRKQGRHELAFAAYTEAWEVLRASGGEDSVEEADLWRHWGVASMGVENHGEAVDCFKRAITMYQRHGVVSTPSYARVLKYGGDAQRQLQDFPSAIAWYEEANDMHAKLGTTLSPDFAELQEVMGDTLEQFGNHDGALVRYNTAQTVVSLLQKRNQRSRMSAYVLPSPTQSDVSKRLSSKVQALGLSAHRKLSDRDSSLGGVARSNLWPPTRSLCRSWCSFFCGRTQRPTQCDDDPSLSKIAEPTQAPTVRQLPREITFGLLAPAPSRFLRL